VGIGPYAAIDTNRVLRATQRALTNFTRKPVPGAQSWYPLDNLLNDTPTRTEDNGHPKAGAIRDEARRTITGAIDAIGGRKFELSPAPQALDGDDVHGIHQHYAVGDLHAGIVDALPDPNDVVVGIDVDYYADPHALLGSGNPAIFHTFNPVSVAGSDADCRFRISGDTVTYEVSGGGTWTHKIWDWCAYGEFIESSVPITSLWQQLLSFCGVEKVVYHKVVHSRPWSQSPHRVLVWCLPQFRHWRLTWAPLAIRARRLQRVKYSSLLRPGWNALVVHEKDGDLSISLGRQGEDACISLRKIDYDTLMGLSSAQSVTSRMIGLGYKEAGLMALMGQHFSGKPSPTAETPRIARPVDVRVHWPMALMADEPEISARAYAAPLVTDHNCAPMIKRWETLSLSLDRRVADYANTKPVPKRYQQYFHEWMRLVVPEHLAGTGQPFSLEHTAALLDKPSQTLAVKQIWETVDQEPRRLIEAFVKNEPCMKNPRIISSFADMRFLLTFSQYTLAFREQVLHAEHNRHWFVPGSTPTEIAERVQNYVARVDRPAEGDYKNLDGSVSAGLQRSPMNASYHRFFHPDHRADLTKKTDMLINCPARAKRFGYKYDAGEGVKSGSPTTTDLTTDLNGGTQYCAVRMTKPDLTPQEAFQEVGLCYGDDSLFDAQYATAWTRCCAALGLTIKIEKFAPENGVTFLGRVFVDPWSTNTSIQDPLRTWRKLHMTMRDPNVPIGDAAIDRLSGYLITDGLTPITSNYARMVVRCYESGTFEATNAIVREGRKDASREKPYWLTHDGGAWPQAHEDIHLMLSVISARTGLSEEELRALADRLDLCNDPWATPAVDRDDEPSPYEDTLDLDHQPCGGGVDDRQAHHDAITHTNRISEHGATGTANHHPRPQRGAPAHKQGRGGSTRSGPVRGMPPGVRSQAGPRDGKPPGEAPRGGLPARAGTARAGGRGRPTQGEARQPRAEARRESAAAAPERGRRPSRRT